jgi:hypothetical protein
MELGDNMARKFRFILSLTALILALSGLNLAYGVQANSYNDTIQPDPGYVTLIGTIYYYDRHGQLQPASNIIAQLIEVDDGGSSANDILQETITDASGNFYFQELNFDIDGPTGDRRLDLYVMFLSANYNYAVLNLDGAIYNWSTDIIYNAESFTYRQDKTVSQNDNWAPALWMQNDIKRTRDFIQDNTNPSIDPGFMSVRWEENINTHRSCPVSCYIPGEYAFIADRRKNAPDVVVHELTHHIMYNINDHIPSSPNCANHSINRASDAVCAFGEGWAEFLPLLVNGDECYDCGLGPCGYNADWYFDLEFSTRDTPNFDYGDTVEGRVAAAFFDLCDPENESPWYDDEHWGFEKIAHVMLNRVGQDTFSEFYSHYANENLHYAIRSLFQNTIDYNTAPYFYQNLPIKDVLGGFYYQQLLHLPSYIYDNESDFNNLQINLHPTSAPFCNLSINGAFLSGDFSTITQGHCEALIEVSDSLTSTWQLLVINIHPATNAIYFPAIQDNSFVK